MTRAILLTTLLSLIVPASGCIDEEACRACIEDQISLRRELVEDGLEAPGSVPTQDMARQACSRAVIAPGMPCKRKTWHLWLVGGLGVAAGLALALRKTSRGFRGRRRPDVGF